MCASQSCEAIVTCFTLTESYRIRLVWNAVQLSWYFDAHQIMFQGPTAADTVEAG